MSSLRKQQQQKQQDVTSETTTTNVAILSQDHLPRGRYWFEIPISDPSIYDPSQQQFQTSIPSNREDRFPSIEERVKIYMGNSWYIPRCNDTLPLKHTIAYEPDPTNNTTTDRIVTMHDPIYNNISLYFDTTIRNDKTFLFDRHVVLDCSRRMKQYNQQVERDGILPKTDHHVQDRESNNWRCADILDLWMPGAMHVKKNMDSPKFVRFGDSFSTENIPIIAKIRPANNHKNSLLSQSNSQSTPSCLPMIHKDRQPPLDKQHRMIDSRMMYPILWKIESKRHFQPIVEVSRNDIPWNEKKPHAIWYGVMTGQPYDNDNPTTTTTTKLSNLDRCKRNQRCNFVYQHLDSKDVVTGLTDTMGRLNDHVDNTLDMKMLLKPSISMKEILKYKILISLDGNDISSGLKWNLYSNSIVMMPPPTLTLWAMEELLVPWVHYIPIYPNGSNTEQMIRWIHNNDEKAQMIAKRSTIFMKDLVGDYDDNNRDDNRDDTTMKHAEELHIKRDIRERYYQLWGY